MFWRLLLATLASAAILAGGLWFLRAFSSRTGPDADAPPQDVADLDVFFVCRECGTEYQVTKVGPAPTVPRHCGESMEVLHRPRT